MMKTRLSHTGMQKLRFACTVTVYAFCLCGLLESIRHPNDAILKTMDDNLMHCDFAQSRFDYINCFLEVYPTSTQLRRDDLVTASDDCIPIFVLFSERISALLEVIRSLHKNIRTCFEIVVFDDNSTYAPTIAALKWLERMKELKVHVHYHKEVWTDFNNLFLQFGKFVESYLAPLNTEVFVINDADCALDSSPPNILSIYRDILIGNLTGRRLRGVGASIRWDDWPAQSFKMEYERVPRSLPAAAVSVYSRNFYYIDADVDTTFVMYRKSDEIHRLAKPTIRLLPPLGIRHLDFYIEKENIPPDYEVYLSRAKEKRASHMIHI